MSEFFKALGQAERDRALREQARARQTGHDDAAPASVDVVPVVHEEAVDVGQARTVTETPIIVDRPSLAAAAVPRNGERKRRARGPSSHVAPDESAEIVDGHLVSLVTPATFEAEQYRALRQIIEEARVRSGVTVVAISSPSVGDGKTTTAINLAGALAQSPEARVLLVDTDLRRPSIAASLGLQATPSPGLVGAITDASLTVADIVRRRPPFNLDVLPAGDRPTAPYELLRSPRFGELLQEARRLYDYVILDTPPLVAVPDCRVIADSVDRFVVVVAAHRTPKRLVEDALSVMEPEKVIGLLFNRDDRPLSGYYNRAYGQYANGNGHRKWAWERP
jgi:capsular exopolysaccharide synthesis family protein